MHSRRFSFVSLLLAGLVLVVGSLAFAAVRTAVQPAAMASIDLLKMLDKLVERAEMEASMQAMLGRVEDEFKRRSEDLQARAKEADTLKEPTARQARRDELALEQLRLKEWFTLQRTQWDREYALRWEGLFRNIVAEAGRLAESQGYDYVVVNDGLADFRADPRSQQPVSQQITEQIMRRRLLYCAKKDDVSDELILRMNNARTGSQQSGATAPSASTPNTTAPNTTKP